MKMLPHKYQLLNINCVKITRFKFGSNFKNKKNRIRILQDKYQPKNIIKLFSKIEFFK